METLTKTTELPGTLVEIELEEALVRVYFEGAAPVEYWLPMCEGGEDWDLIDTDDMPAVVAEAIEAELGRPLTSPSYSDWAVRRAESGYCE